MNNEIRPDRTETERISTLRILPPASLELFQAGEKVENGLPTEISGDVRLIEQASFRRNLYAQLDQIYTAVPDPDMSIDESIRQGLLAESTATEVWHTLATFLEQDVNNVRLLLYLPFQLLPDLGFQTQDNETTAVKQQLADMLWQGWIRLLHESEPRANYVDGDILEPGLGKPERISKAGHLTPELLSKAIITPHEVVVILETLNDKEMLQSLAEGIIVSHDSGLINGSDWEKIQKLIEQKVGDVYHHPQTESYINNPDSDKISPARSRWLRKIMIESRDTAEVNKFSHQILNNQNISELEQQGLAPKILISAIMEAGEQIASLNPVQAGQFIHQNEDFLRNSWNSDDLSVRDSIINGLNHLVRLGVIQEVYLKKFGIRLTDLSLPSQYDEIEFSAEFQHLLKAAEKISQHPVLSGMIFPGFLLFGSRLKGYADTKADLDAAVFFKPEAKPIDREKALAMLRNDIPELTQSGHFLEFWTALENGKLTCTPPVNDSRIQAGEDQIHFLMGGAWIGYGNEIARLRNDMLQRYVDLSRFGMRKEQLRRQYLGQLELDILQYRLMHKGYRKYYPEHKKAGTPNADLIDWSSDFWDSGYRRVASKLFVSRVFLPDLS